MRSGEFWERKTLVPRTSESASGSLPTLTAHIRGNPNKHWMTLTAYDAKPAGQKELDMMLLYESGTNVPDTYKRLRSQVAARETIRWQTLTVQDANGRDRHNQRDGSTTLSLLGQARARSGVSGGPLNPDWCDWFMGFPIGWTALEPLGMHKFQAWLVSHGRP